MPGPRGQVLVEKGGRVSVKRLAKAPCLSHLEHWATLSGVFLLNFLPANHPATGRPPWAPPEEAGLGGSRSGHLRAGSPEQRAIPRCRPEGFTHGWSTDGAGAAPQAAERGWQEGRGPAAGSPGGWQSDGGGGRGR